MHIKIADTPDTDKTIAKREIFQKAKVALCQKFLWFRVYGSGSWSSDFLLFASGSGCARKEQPLLFLVHFEKNHTAMKLSGRKEKMEKWRYNLKRQSPLWPKASK
jgi:hypothetical protein